MFVSGSGCAALAIMAWIVFILSATRTDALWVLALWIPAAMTLPLVILVSCWTAKLIYLGRKFRMIAIGNAAAAWVLAAAYIVFLILTIFFP